MNEKGNFFSKKYQLMRYAQSFWKSEGKENVAKIVTPPEHIFDMLHKGWVSLSQMKWEASIFILFKSRSWFLLH